ncbi:MAG: hypothetical protein V4616_01695 [Bacteroidota bacterium]
MKPAVFFLLLLIAAGCAPRIYNQAAWREVPVTVDGDPAEYELFNFYSAESGIAYTLTNDLKNLYFCFKIEDPRVQQEVMKYGLEIYIDTTKKATQYRGIRYPLPSRIGSRGRGELFSDDQLPTADRPDIRNLHKRFLEDQNIVEFRNLKGVSGVHQLKNKTGIKLSLNWDSTNAMIYEGIVPLERFYHSPLRPADSLQVFTLTVNIRSLGPVPPNGGRSGIRGTGISVGGGFGGGFGGGMGLGGGVMVGGPRSGMNGPVNQKSGFSNQFRLAVQ